MRPAELRLGLASAVPAAADGRRPPMSVEGLRRWHSRGA